MNIKSIANKTMFGLKQASPTIAVVAGIGTGIFATYLACKATLKVDAVLDEAKKNIDKVHEVANDPELSVRYSDENKSRDLAIIYGQTIWKLAKLYGPAVLVGGGSIALIIGSHHMMTKRVAALSATVAVLGESLERYRMQVAELYGEEKENDIYYGFKNEKIDEVVVDEETGKETKKKLSVKVVDEEKVVSPYAVFFDKSNPNYVEGDFIYNSDFISDVQNELNRRLTSRGWLFLNDARMALGYKPLPEGQVMGWTWDDKKDGPFDPSNPPIDLGINHIGRQNVRDFKNGYEKVLVINFDGVKPIIETFHLFDKSNRIA